MAWLGSTCSKFRSARRVHWPRWVWQIVTSLAQWHRAYKPHLFHYYFGGKIYEIVWGWCVLQGVARN